MGGLHWCREMISDEKSLNGFLFTLHKGLLCMEIRNMRKLLLFREIIAGVPRDVHFSNFDRRKYEIKDGYKITFNMRRK